MEKATFGFGIYKIWHILKRFIGAFREVQTLKLRGVQNFFKFNKAHEAKILKNTLRAT